MFSKAIQDLDYSDLQALIGRARESKTLEFKRELPKGNAGALKVLKGVTALANTMGGDFVIGVADHDGVAQAVDGIEVNGVDGYKQMLDQILLDLVEPKLPRVDIKEIPCPNGRWAFVIRATRSWQGPHRVLADKNFYVRTSTGSVPLDVADLRVAFGLRETAIERIEAFRRERLAKIMAGDVPVNLVGGTRIVLHTAPLPNFANREWLDIVRMMQNGTHMPVPLRGRGGQARVNLEGVCNEPLDAPGGSTGYGQLFRNGAYEALSTASVNEDGPYLASEEIGNTIMRAVKFAVSLHRAYGFPFPIFVMLSLCDAASLTMIYPTEIGAGFYRSRALGREVVSFPDVSIENEHTNIAEVLRPLLNMLWNAFGLPSCSMYNAQGDWIGVA